VVPMNGVCDRLTEVSPLFVKRMKLLGMPSEKIIRDDGIVITRVRVHPAYSKVVGWERREFVSAALEEDNRF